MKYNSCFGEDNYSKIWTVPNLITGLGIVFILFYIFFVFNGWPRSAWVLVLAVLAGLSDLADGHLARRLNQCSWLGERLDPLRDRLLFLALFAHLVLLRGPRILLCPALGLLVIFEAVIVIGAIKVFPRHIPMRVHIIGKLRQAVNVGIVFLILFFELTKTASWSLVKFFNQLARPLAMDIFSAFFLMAIASGLALAAYTLDYLLRVRPQKA